jgi:hypothetical protein
VVRGEKFICNFGRDTHENGHAIDQAVRALASHHTPSFSDLGETACEIRN